MTRWELIEQNRRYVTSEQLHRFLLDSSRQMPSPILGCATTGSTRIGRIFPDGEMRKLVNDYCRLHEIQPPIMPERDGLEITFDSSTAFEIRESIW